MNSDPPQSTNQTPLTASPASTIPTVTTTKSTLTTSSSQWSAYEQCKATFGNSTVCNVINFNLKKLILIFEDFFFLLKYPGQVWNANDQCQMINGNSSFYCTVCH